MRACNLWPLVLAARSRNGGGAASQALPGGNRDDAGPSRGAAPRARRRDSCSRKLETARSQIARAMRFRLWGRRYVEASFACLRRHRGITGPGSARDNPPAVFARLTGSRIAAGRQDLLRARRGIGEGRVCPPPLRSGKVRVGVPREAGVSATIASREQAPVAAVSVR